MPDTCANCIHAYPRDDSPGRSHCLHPLRDEIVGGWFDVVSENEPPCYCPIGKAADLIARITV